MPRLPHANVNSKLGPLVSRTGSQQRWRELPNHHTRSNIRRRGPPSGRDHQHSAFRQFFRSPWIKSAATSDCAAPNRRCTLRLEIGLREFGWSGSRSCDLST